MLGLMGEDALRFKNKSRHTAHNQKGAGEEGGGGWGNRRDQT